MLLLGIFVVVLFGTATAVSTLTLRDYAVHPVIAFERVIEQTEIGPRMERVVVGSDTDLFGQQTAGTARPMGGAGALIGYRHRFRLADGSTIACLHVLSWMQCDDGWMPERAGAPGA